MNGPSHQSDKQCAGRCCMKRWDRTELTNETAQTLRRTCFHLLPRPHPPGLLHFDKQFSIRRSLGGLGIFHGVMEHSCDKSG